MRQDGDIKPPEMEKLHALFVLQPFAQVGSRVFRCREMHHMRIPFAVGNLHDAKPVTLVIEPHRFGIDRDVAVKRYLGGQIMDMKEIRDNNLVSVGAQKRTRTSKTLRSLVPETSASTNSAIWAVEIAGNVTYIRSAPRVNDWNLLNRRCNLNRITF